MDLALFDLDHTLIPFDSGMAWTRHLAGRAVLPADAPERYLEVCRRYVARHVAIEDVHRACIAPLAALSPVELGRELEAFEAAVAGQVSDAARELVARHRGRGDLCAIVTATSRLVALPFARLFGIDHLIATEPVLVEGRPTGEIDGFACHGAHKPVRVAAWLERREHPPHRIADFGRSHFYSDSAGDLPLLESVTDPVAVDADAQLRKVAQARGWSIVQMRVAAG